MAEAWASSLGETNVGIWMGKWHTALTTHYGLDAYDVQYFSKHYEADTQEHEEGVMAHGLGNEYILQRLLEDGYRQERPGVEPGLQHADVRGPLRELPGRAVQAVPVTTAASRRRGALTW